MLDPQIALFRDLDWSLLAADAFVTVRHDSYYRVLIRKIEVNGPPRYLDALEPELVIPGHGAAMEGVKLRSSLRNLAEHFDLEALLHNRLHYNVFPAINGRHHVA